MADFRFFKLADPMPLGELARRCGAELNEWSVRGQIFVDVSPLDSA
jgi:hypothetical protein